MPTVSAIVTTCDRPEMLAEALRSVQAQTFADIEILVCDDASDARTSAVVQTAQEVDSRILYLRNETRLGQRSNALQGLRKATGVFVAFCHDDDAWEPEFLARASAVMDNHPEVVAAFSDHWIVDPTGCIDRQATEENTRRWKRDLLAPGLQQPFMKLAVVDQALPTVMAALLRLSAIDLDDFPEQIGANYDLWLAYLLSRGGGAAWYISERLTRYRVHSASATAGGGVALSRSSVFIWERLLGDRRLMTIHPALRRKLAGGLTSLGIRLLRESNRSEARLVLRRAFTLRPTPRSAMAWTLTLLPPYLAKWAAR
jgi:glycosyltransferase involved in cell wall biosynthesis